MTRRSLFFLGMGACVLAGGAVQACGSDGSAVVPNLEAGTDAPLDTTPAPDAAEDDPSCGPGLMLLDRIPDASFGDGASTGRCLGCLRQRCSTFIEACNASCDCQTAVATALQCVLTTNDTTACAGPLLGGGVSGEVQQIGLGLALCVSTQCGDDCRFEGRPDGGPDAGDAGDAGDGGTTPDGGPDAGDGGDGGGQGDGGGGGGA